MQSLSNEVQLLILQYIDTKRDLKSLCLTSKHLRNLNLPRLYHTVYLHTREEGLTRFFKCIAAGASYHLRHIRSLSFEDELRDTLEIGLDDQALESAADARGTQMHLLISMLPENQLHAFKSIHLIMSRHRD